MVATMTKRMTLTGFLFALLLGLFVFFGTPIQSYADQKGADIGSINVDISEDGKMTIGGNDNFTTGGSGKAWTQLIGKYKKFIVGISGIGAVSMIVFFIFQFMKLGASAGNPSARSQALAGVLWTGLAAAGLGAVTIIVGFFYNSIG